MDQMSRIELDALGVPSLFKRLLIARILSGALSGRVATTPPCHCASLRGRRENVARSLGKKI